MLAVGTVATALLVGLWLGVRGGVAGAGAAPAVPPAPAAPSAPAPSGAVSSPDPDPEPEPEADPPAPAPAGPRAFEGAVLTLPAGWRLDDAGDGTACVTRTPGGCELLLVLPDVARARGADLGAPDSDAARGWHLGPGEPDCRSSRLVARDLAPLDDKRAEYREWQLDCTGEPDRLRLWWLPRTRFAALDRSGDPALARVITRMVRTADLGGLRTR